MSIYGELIKESKTMKKSSKYELDGIIGNIEDNELSKLMILIDYPILTKNYNIFLKQVAEKYYEYVKDNSNFRSIKDVLKDIKLKSWEYSVIIVKSNNKVLRSFIPYIDFSHPIDDHVPSIEAYRR